MSSHYEELYGVSLLDDLHNYFPALLYEPEQFPSVQSALRYIQQQTRNRFDLFSLGMREYRGREAPSPPVPPPPTSVPSVRVSNRVASDVSGGSVQINSTLLPASPPPAGSPRRLLGPILESTLGNRILPNFYQYTFNLPEPEEEEVNITTQLLTTLLNIPMATRRAGAGMDAFLQPVVVRPTAEQIEANTTVGNLVTDTEQTCAICQDVLQPEQEGRKLNACAHWFHKSCIDTWLDGNVHCPVCRHDIREPINQTDS